MTAREELLKTLKETNNDRALAVKCLIEKNIGDLLNDAFNEIRKLNVGLPDALDAAAVVAFACMFAQLNAKADPVKKALGAATLRNLTLKTFDHIAEEFITKRGDN